MAASIITDANVAITPLDDPDQALAAIDQATALGKSPGGIRFGIMARCAGVEMARARPKVKATVRMPATLTRHSYRGADRPAWLHYTPFRWVNG